MLERPAPPLTPSAKISRDVDTRRSATACAIETHEMTSFFESLADDPFDANDEETAFAVNALKQLWGEDDTTAAEVVNLDVQRIEEALDVGASGVDISVRVWTPDLFADDLLDSAAEKTTDGNYRLAGNYCFELLRFLVEKSLAKMLGTYEVRAAFPFSLDVEDEAAESDDAPESAYGAITVTGAFLPCLEGAPARPRAVFQDEHLGPM